MTLPAGTRLGPYEILAPLGAGGMGEVYRARDTRLEREVAIKVLPAEVASDAERLKRFEKEARSASALNHQNIDTIHDIGSENGVPYIAMEVVEGATLRELLVGPLPNKRLLHIAPQIAEGLAQAHDAGRGAVVRACVSRSPGKMGRESPSRGSRLRLGDRMWTRLRLVRK